MHRMEQAKDSRFHPVSPAGNQQRRYGMKPKKPGPYILVYLLLVLLFIGFFVPAGLILTTDGILPFKYQRYQYHIGITSMVLALIFLVISIKFMIWGMRRMATNLDILFQDLGLSAEKYAADGRHFFGDMEGRRIDIYCKPVKNRRYFGDVKTVKYIGHALDIYVEGDVNTRSSIGLVREGEGIHGKIRAYMIKYLTEKFIDKFGGQLIKMNDPRYQDLEIYALDQVWTQAFLENEDVSGALLKLLGEDIRCIRQHVHVTPKAVHFTTLTNIRYLKPDIINLIVGNVTQIATTAESLKKATITSEATDQERNRGVAPE